MTVDHLIVAARTLDEGAAYIRERLGVEVVPGGKHPTMGTHNRVLSLGGETYLEVMAVDPDATAPSHPRWIALDEPATQALLRTGPALIHWVERTDDLEAAVRASPEALEIRSFSRGPYRWRMGLRADGSLPGGGSRPTFIQWDSAHPASNLPPSGCHLADPGGPDRGDARFRTPTGERRLPWRLPRNPE